MTRISHSSVKHDQKSFLKSVCFKSSKLSPITSIIPNENEGYAQLSKDQLIFCYRTAIYALKYLLDGDYIKFDPLTTTNCCHGMSLLVRQLILESLQMNISELLAHLENKHQLLTENTELSSFQHVYLPHPIVNLAQLYILSIIKEIDFEHGGWRTNIHNLKTIFPLGTKFCTDIVKHLQLKFSNLIAHRYQDYLEYIPNDFFINNVSIDIWGKYVQPEYIRNDRRGRNYAACLYSMQVALAFLIHCQAKIFFVNDLKCENGIFKGRHTQILEGDGHFDFRLVDIDDIRLDDLTPLIIFCGCTHSRNVTEKALQFHINPWLQRFQSLILACDTYYPQFPLVRDDPDFDSNPINPEEDIVNHVIAKHNNISGVSAVDSSLFCLTHIYVASFKQIILSAKGEKTVLPRAFIPLSKSKSKDS